jgi:hypothetical protein
MLLDNVKILYCSTTLILRSPFPSLLYIGAIAPNSISPRIINKKSFFLFCLFCSYDILYTVQYNVRLGCPSNVFCRTLSP